MFGLALGYEDLNDHDQLRKDPLFGVLVEKAQSKRQDCEALAGKSTLNRLELFGKAGFSLYHKILSDSAAIEGAFVVFLDSYAQAPAQIVDLDATDAPLHGEQGDRFFYGYYDHYCYLPLYIFCGKQLLCAKLRPANIDGSAGAIEQLSASDRFVNAGRTPGSSCAPTRGFAREALMTWCDQHAIHYVFGLARATHACNASSAPSCTTPGNAARLPA